MSNKLTKQIKSSTQSKIGWILLMIVAVLTLGTALAHLSCLYFGAACYEAQLAPDFLVESARNGTWLAPLLNVLVSTIFIVWGGYALSAAQIIRRLPALKYVIWTIATLCMIRGFLPIQLWLRYPEKISGLMLIVGFVWFFTGLFYLIGYRFRSR